MLDMSFNMSSVIIPNKPNLTQPLVSSCQLHVLPVRRDKDKPCLVEICSLFSMDHHF